MVVIASPNREYPPEPDALALAALVVKSLDELTPDAIESAAQRARKQRASGAALQPLVLRDRIGYLSSQLSRLSCDEMGDLWLAGQLEAKNRLLL